VPALNALAQDWFDADRRYSDVVHFVHVNVIEPHPSHPDPSPYSGEVWESGSSEPQPRTFSERVILATAMAADLVGGQIMLVDDLTPAVRDNPLWCTYGPAPNSAYLIDRNGVIRVVQKWVDPPALRAAIQQVLSH
jgi:hypothetical protein